MSNNESVEASYEAKLRLVRDCVRKVADRSQPGLFLHGPGGTGKTHTITTTLKEVGRPYYLANSHMTGRGLFETLRDHSDSVILLEDLERLYSDRSVPGILRSALEGQTGDDGKEVRVIHWITARHHETVEFTGGIILVSNSACPTTGEWNAVKSRIDSLEFKPTNDEVAFKMMELAHLGHVHGGYKLNPEACVEVAQEIISRTNLLQQTLDLRLLIKTFRDRIFCERGLAESHWLDLLDARMKERVIVGTRQPESRGDKASRHLTVLQGMAGLSPKAQLEKWKNETGQSKAAFYRWKNRFELN